jgi:hypothetical protein
MSARYPGGFERPPRARLSARLSWLARLILLPAAVVMLAAAIFVLGVFVLVWSINDIAVHGAKFWNVLWLVVVSVTFIGAAPRLKIKLKLRR